MWMSINEVAACRRCVKMCGDYIKNIGINLVCMSNVLTQPLFSQSLCAEERLTKTCTECYEP